MLVSEMLAGRVTLEVLPHAAGEAAGPAAGQRRTSSVTPAQPLPRQQRQQAATAAAATLAARREAATPAAPRQLSPEEQQRGSAAAAAAAAAADRMAQLLMVRSGCLWVPPPVVITGARDTEFHDSRCSNATVVRVADEQSSTSPLRSICRTRRQPNPPPRVPSRPARRRRSPESQPRMQSRLLRPQLRTPHLLRPLQRSLTMGTQPPAAVPSPVRSQHMDQVPAQAQERCRLPAARRTKAGSCVP